MTEPSMTPEQQRAARMLKEAASDLNKQLTQVAVVAGDTVSELDHLVERTQALRHELDVWEQKLHEYHSAVERMTLANRRAESK